jgi:glucoamylase
MVRARGSIALLAAAALGLLLVSGGSATDPRTPAALPGRPAPFLGTAVAGSGGLTAAVDAYGDLVDLRPGPAGPALIDNPSARQAAGSLAPNTGIVPRVRIGSGRWLPPWRADAVRQRYLGGTNVVRTVARFGGVRVVTTVAAEATSLAVAIAVSGGGAPSVSVSVADGVRCAREGRVGQLDLLCGVGRAVPPVSGEAAGEVHRQCARLVRAARARDRRWLGRARALGPGAPEWAQKMYDRSLLTLLALSDRRTGAVAAGARDGWAYVWPRDAATAALAYAAAGYDGEACRAAGFLSRLDLGAAARFEDDGTPVPGRAAQGDATGWVEATLPDPRVPPPMDRKTLGTRDRASGACRPRDGGGAAAQRATRLAWRDRADYREGSAGDYLGNAIAAGAPLGAFRTSPGLVRTAGDAASGLDAAAAWAIRPFPRPALYPAVRATLLHLLARGTRFGITPGEGWPGTDPWTAPTAWSAWALAALAQRDRTAAIPVGSRGARRAESRRLTSARRERRAALTLLADLRRAATPAGELPERVGAHTGIPRSTTPLAWSHAFAILALRQLWPAPTPASRIRH